MSALFFGVPLIAADQAQKHVPANTATDALAALLAGTVASRSAPAPASPADGAVHIVPDGSFVDASGATLAVGDVAARLGGVWHGGPAPIGHAVTVLDEGRQVVHAGSGTWLAGGVLGDLGGAAAGLEVREQVLTLTGPSVTAAALIPDRSIVFGVASKVLTTITGATAYRVGGAGQAADAFGGSLGLAAGSVNRGVVGPFATYADASVVVTAEGPDFTGGEVRVSALILRAEAA
ncbi:MAG: DUF2793 domain-containing protein [Pseudomonadota bacterium]